MKKLLYSLFLSCSVLLASCDKEEKKATQAEPTQFQVVVKATQVGTQTGPSARVSLSRKPIRTAAKTDIFMSAPVYPGAAQTVIDDTKWDKVDFPSRTLYASLYYQSVTSSTFSAPKAGDQTQITVTPEGKPAVTLTINAASYQDGTLRWTDAEGKVHSGKEISFEY